MVLIQEDLRGLWFAQKAQTIHTIWIMQRKPTLLGCWTQRILANQNNSSSSSIDGGEEKILLLSCIVQRTANPWPTIWIQFESKYVTEMHFCEYISWFIGQGIDFCGHVSESWPRAGFVKTASKFNKPPLLIKKVLLKTNDVASPPQNKALLRLHHHCPKFRLYSLITGCFIDLIVRRQLMMIRWHWLLQRFSIFWVASL